MFDSRRLEAFCKVYEHRSFSRAGEELFLSQPTVSAHVLALEKTLGMALFDRLGRAVVPTRAGDILYHYGIESFKQLALARTELAALRDEVAGELVVGASTIPAHCILPPVIAGLLQEFPAVQVHIAVSDTATVIERVASGDIPVGVVGGSTAHPDLCFDFLYEDALVCIASPLQQYPKLESLDDMEKLPWIMREHGSGTRDAFLKALSAISTTIVTKLTTVLTVCSTESVIQYVRCGVGVGVVSHLAADELLQRGELITLGQPFPLIKRSFYLVHHKRRTLLPTVERFRFAIKEWSKDKVC